MPTLIKNTSQDEITALYTNKYRIADTVIVGINDGTMFNSPVNQEELKAIIGTRAQCISANKNGVLVYGLNDSFEFETTGYEEIAALRGLEAQQRNATKSGVSIDKVNAKIKVTITQVIGDKEVETIYILESIKPVFGIIEELKKTNKSKDIRWEFKRIKI